MRCTNRLILIGQMRAPQNKHSLLRYETVSPLLRDILVFLMGESLFEPFRLVGGTNLSLRYGHRRSEDIDLFSDREYGSLDFRAFAAFLRSNFGYYECNDSTSIVACGRSYYVGNSVDESVKIDLMYADAFMKDADLIEGIRLAGVEDIVAMKMDVVARGGRKKDFWDLHLLLREYLLKEMIDFHAKRYEWSHDRNELLERFVDFEIADVEPDPCCLLGKDWDDIKLDLIEELEQYVEGDLENGSGGCDSGW